MKRQCTSIGPMQPAARYRVAAALLTCLTVLLLAGAVLADIPGRRTPAGTSVPNPGTQQQELANITMPAPYNVFEFVVTCMACHGGSMDQQAGHGGNWAGSNMASSMRDPVFRANQILTNSQVKAKTGQDGAGNLCMRCHSPNGWYSGRFDPLLAGAADGSTTEHSIVLSTDDEGISCEFCHRAVGAVSMQRPDLDPADPAWNMLSGILDWPHAGNPYPAGPVAGNPYGDATLQINDAMSYGGKYGGNGEMFFSDTLGFFSETGAYPSGTYTGQTYGIYPWFYTGPQIPPPAGMPKWNANGEALAYNADGALSIAFESAALPGDQWGAMSPEHTTRRSDFVLSPEFCGSCHNVTIPVLNHGMPQQRTYTEWKYSSFADQFAVKPDGTPYYKRCQDCHMPTLMHEYADNAPVSFNPDPLLSGWYPYSKDRNFSGGTTFHKFNGSNRNLPMMMKVLYPEVDLEVVGAPTGRDTRIFPGLQSSRDFTWDREQRNTELSLRDTANVQFTSGPVFNALTGLWEVTVKVTNNTGHKIPSGYPDGRRIWLGLSVKDNTGATVYQSGAYDPVTANLSNDPGTTTLTRARTTTINSASNAVMIYEKRTGALDPATGTYAMSVSLLNEAVLFDNRIPPVGFTYAPYAAEGAKFWNYMGDDTAATPFEASGRYPDGQNWDEVTYTFTAPPTATLTARAELYYQSQTREQMDFLKNNDTSALRPEGPPSILAPNYPLTPTYLSDSLTRTTGVNFATMTDLAGVPLRDNWGGVAFAAWLQTGMGAPFAIAADDTAVALPPAAPVGVTATVFDPFAINVSWSPVAGADGYIVWVRYGMSDLTASWDRLALVPAAQTMFRNDGLNIAKTYAYKVQAYNAKGTSPDSAVIMQSTPTDLPLPPENLQVVTVTDATVTLAWFDVADNETGFRIERQDVPLFTNQPLPLFVEIKHIVTPNGAGFGGVNFTDTGLLPGRTYNYRVAAFNASGPSTWNINGPVAATTLRIPPAPSNLTATAINPRQVDLAWVDNAGSETGFRIERYSDGVTFTPVGAVGPNVTAFSDLTALPSTTYSYRVVAFNAEGSSTFSNVATVTTPVAINVPTKIGVYRDGQLYRDLNGNGVWDNATLDSFTLFGIFGDVPVTGDWNGTGTSKIGVFRNGQWYLDINGNSIWDNTTSDSFTQFGIPGDIPVAGDWNNTGASRIGVFRNGQWYLDLDGSRSWDPAMDVVYSFGIPGDIPVTGDWNNTGTTKIGVFRNGQWYLDINGNGGWDPATDAIHNFGIPGDTPVCGTW